MRSITARCALGLVIFGSLGSLSAQNIVITEIMYHPSSENDLEEYVELLNMASTNVNLGGWRLTRGIDYTFSSNTVIEAGAYLVVAADLSAFNNKYPGVNNVVGGWQGVLRNSQDTIELENPEGDRVDIVTYADEGDWSFRQRMNIGGRPSWEWNKQTDGLGSSLELKAAGLPNEYGQNWRASEVPQGTPGQANSVGAGFNEPMVVDVKHFPVIPTSSDSVIITARRVSSFVGDIMVRLNWRIDSPTPPSFTNQLMYDDGAHGDGVANDGVYGIVLPPMANDTLVEFYVEAGEVGGTSVTWPAPARLENGTFAPAANATFQVDNSIYTGEAPLYKLIMTSADYSNLSTIFSSSPNSDAQVNATFIVLERGEVEYRYLCGVRNRGHGSRSGNPHNYRINLRNDEPWNGQTGINMNARNVHLQHFGSVLAQKAGVLGGDSRAVQMRVNNGPGPGGTPQFGHYAANEVVNGAWIDRHFPEESGGNVYKVIRDINPATFDYRGSNPDNYRNTYFKQNNESEDDWSDLIGMLSVVGTENIVPFNENNVRSVINVEQWLTHLAVMALFDNNESGINTGNNDDYYQYAGFTDGRFQMLFHDLDTILNGNENDGIFNATQYPGENGQTGVGLAFDRFMHDPAFEPIYYSTLQRLIDTAFSQAEFDALADRTLGFYVPTGTINSIKNWMNNRRNFVRNLIASSVPPQAGVATVEGVPRSPTWRNAATLTVGGSGITHYRFRLNGGNYSAETPVATPIQLNGLAQGSTNTVYVIGRTAQGAWQSMRQPTVSDSWVVNTGWSRVRLNEILAVNQAAVNHEGTFPDYIELYNEGNTTVDLSGMRLSDSASNSNKYTFPPGSQLAANDHLLLWANNPDATSGVHLGFSLDQSGDGVFFFDAVSAGGALLDSVRFGHQLADASISRIGEDGGWYLANPTPDSANVRRATGDVTTLKINEWLANSGVNPYLDDFVELYNPDSLPVNIGELFLSDQPVGAPFLGPIRALTFIDGGGFLSLLADGQKNDAGHVDFQLSSEVGQIALLDGFGTIIDCVAYGPQTKGISEGRCPNGDFDIYAQSFPTPGAPNSCPGPPIPPQRVNIIPYNHTWKYEASNVDLIISWRLVGYNDAGWLSGQTLIGFENGDTPVEPINTFLNQVNGRVTTYYRTMFDFNVPNASAVEITHIIDDGAVFYVNGAEVGRFNMPGGTIDFTTSAGTVVNAVKIGGINVPLDLLQPTGNLLAVELHQNNQNSADQLFGLSLDAIVVTNRPSAAGLVINEILADNATYAESDGRTPDKVEIYNPSMAPVDLAGLSLTDDLADPRRWVFPTGSIVQAQGFLTILCDSGAPLSSTNTGFGLNNNGDSLYLIDDPASGGGVMDVVHFGLQAADFSLGRLPDGNGDWNLTLPTFGSANIVAPQGNPALLKVNEWMADPESGDDWFELFNPNDHPVAVGGYYLTDDLNQFDKSQLPALSFIGSQTNGWKRFEADGNIDSGAHHVGFSLRASGEALGFYSPSGMPIDVLAFGQQQTGVSQGRLPDGQATVVFFTETASPGERNYLLLTNVFITEVLSHTDPPLEDAIELFHPGFGFVGLANWWLSDSKDNPFKYQIPEGAVLRPDGYLVIYENQFNSSDFAAYPFALSSAHGDSVYLTAAPNGIPNGYRQEVHFGPSANGVSFGRVPTSIGADFVSQTSLSFGVDAPQSLEEFRTGMGAPNSGPLIGPIVITEIMYHPPDLSTNDNVRDEFVELHNITAQSVPLYDPLYPTNTWRMRRGIDFDFPLSSSIPAGGYALLVSFDPITNLTARAAFEGVYGTNLVLFGPYSGKLDNGGESIELRRPDTPQMLPGPEFGFVPYIVVEHIQFSDMTPWPLGGDGDGLSLQRSSSFVYGNDPIHWFAGVPTPEPAGGGDLDSDGDGMPDSFENAYGFDNGRDDSGEDADMDGMTNLEEHLAGTNPRDPDSLLKVVLDRTGAGEVTLQFLGVMGKSYSVLVKTSLGSGSWATLTNIPPLATSQTVTLTDSVPLVEGQKFYQLVTPATP